MNPPSGMLAQLRGLFESDPLLVIVFVASAIAYATTPLAFLVLGRMDYLRTRRGRSFQPPSFASVVVGMLLVMSIPAIFCALVIKSRYFDRDRYEFDPNVTWSVLEQGRGYSTLREADQAVKAEMDRMANERRALGNALKDLDKAIIEAVNEMGGASPKLVATFKKLNVELGSARKWAQVDAPQQLIDLTATPVDLLIAKNAVAVPIAAPLPGVAEAGGAAAGPVSGLPRATVEAELASVPSPQRSLAALLPLADLPAGWTVGKMGDKHLETFNAENLYEKIDGRAESFLLYDVKGMAYTFYHPTGDESNEVQLYIFEMGNPLKALGKYGSEKPEEASSIAVGKDGYTSAGSTLFYLDKYYVQIVSTRDDPAFAEFSLALARRIEASVDPALAASRASASPSTTATAATPTPTQPKVGPEELFQLLPKEPKRSEPKYSAADVFGYSFLTDVFHADYEDGGASWQGFIRTYASPDEARTIFEKYEAGAREIGAEIKKIEAEEADQIMVVSNFGLTDVVFLKGNAVGGANGAPEQAKAESFTRGFARSLPAQSPFIVLESDSTPEGSESSEK
jgi:hypothetical protein